VERPLLMLRERDGLERWWRCNRCSEDDFNLLLLLCSGPLLTSRLVLDGDLRRFDDDSRRDREGDSFLDEDSRSKEDDAGIPF